MCAAEHAAPGEVFAQEPEDDDDGDAQGEAEQGLGVLAADAPDLLGADGAPEHGGGEEGVLAGADKLEGRVLCADAVEVDLVGDDGDADKGRDQGGDHLGEEGEARRDLDVVGELEVVAEVEGVGAGDVAVRLEEAHGEGVAFHKGAADELGQHVERHFDARHGVDDARGHHEDEAEGDAVEDDAGAGVSWPVGDGGAAEGHADDEDNHVPPLGDLVVLLHQTVVHVEDLALFHLVLFGGAEAVDEVFEAHGNLQSVVEEPVRQGGGVGAEEEHVDDDVAGGEIGRRIGLVLFIVDDAAMVEDGGDIVAVAKVVVRLVRVDWQVGSVVRVCKVHGHDDEHGQEHADEEVESAKEGHHERIDVGRKDVPVKSRKRIEPKAVVGARDVSQPGVVWRNPRHPAESRKRRKDVVGEPEIDKHEREGVEEEVEPRHCPNLAEWSQGRCIPLAVESAVQSNGDEGLWPYTIRRVYQESSADSRETVADEVARQGNQDLIAKVDGPRLVKEVRQKLDPDNVVSVRRALCDTGH